METRIIDNHPSLKNADERFEKMLESIVSSFVIEGIQFSENELLELVQKIEGEIRK